jgi:hypothetical protein
LVVLCLIAGVACSVTSTDGGTTSDTDAGTLPSGSSGSSGTKPPPQPPPPPPACTPDPTCERARCDCPNGEVLEAPPVCKNGGACDFTGACKIACGADTTTAELYKPCSSPIQCQTSAPNVSCACVQGFGWDAYEVCKDGYCSGAKQDVCPDACKNDQGWAGCATAKDCAAVICPCKDGKTAYPDGACNAGSCAAPSTVCTPACAAHGGYTGGPTTPDAGPPGPKNPGDPCTKGSECKPWDCNCTDGQSYKNNMMCLNNQCPTQSDACSLVCLSHGGWAGP